MASDSLNRRIIAPADGETDDQPTLHENTYHRDLSTYLHSLNCRRLRTGQPVNILSQHNSSIIAQGVIKEIVPSEMFAGETGQFHDAVISVRMESEVIQHFSPSRVVPQEPDTSRSTTDREIELTTQPHTISKRAD